MGLSSGPRSNARDEGHDDEHHEMGLVQDQTISDIELTNFLTLIRYFRVDYFEEDLLLLGINTQYRWDDNGNIRAVDLGDTQMSKESIASLHNRERLAELLRLSVRRGLLRKEPDDRKSVCHVNRSPGDNLEDEAPCINSLIFLCYACSRDEAFSDK